MPLKLKAALIAIPLAGSYIGLLVLLFLAPRYISHAAVILGLMGILATGVCALIYIGVLTFLQGREGGGI